MAIKRTVEHWAAAHGPSNNVGSAKENDGDKHAKDQDDDY